MSEYKGEEGPHRKSQLEHFTYPHPRLRDFSLDDNLPVLACPPCNNYISKSPRFDLSALDILPLELLQGMLAQLDVCTLMEFRRVNRRAREVVASIPQYKAVTTYARNALHGILSIQTGQYISCEIIYQKLCTAECEQCGDFGGYLYILTCKRVCFLCLSEEKIYLPLRHSHAIRKFGINNEILDILPCMRSLPGTYSPNEMKSREKIALVDPESASRAGITLHGSAGAMERYVSNFSEQKAREFQRRISQASKGRSGPRAHRLRRPPTEDCFDGRSGNPLRFMAIVRMPWFNKASKALEWGFHCVGCQKCHSNRPLHFRRKFTVASFTEHLIQCGKILNGKHHLE